MVFVSLLTLSACNNASISDEQTSDQEPIQRVEDNEDIVYLAENIVTPPLPTPSPLPLINVVEGDEINIARATDAVLHSFNQIYEMDYEIVRAPDGSTQSNNLVIWTTMPVKDFAFLLIGYDFIEREAPYLDIIYIPIERYSVIYEMQPGDAFVINNIRVINFHDWGMPGVTFVDASGTQRYFLIRSNPDNPFSLEEFHNRTSELPENWEPRWISMRNIPNTNVTAPPSPDRIATLLEESGISEYGWEIAANFLSEMTSIFTGVIEAETDWDNEWEETGRFLLGYDLSKGRSTTTYEVPEIYYVLYEWGIRGVYDRQGDKILEAPWLIIHYSFYSYISHFRLFDFHNTGIPDIFVLYWPIFDGRNTGIRDWYTIFRYVDGEYRKLEWRYYEASVEQFTSSWSEPSSWEVTRFHNFFTDEMGRIITLYDDNKSGSFTGYEQFIITDEYVMLYPIAVMERGEENRELWQAWYDHMFELNSPTIFGTDIQLTPLHSFRDLEIGLFEYLQYKRLHTNNPTP